MATASRLESVPDIERELARLRNDSTGEGEAPYLRTSVMTHMAWVPKEWVKAATQVLEGLAERHPSRTIMLLPDSDASDGLEGEASLECFPLEGGRLNVCSEVITLHLGGNRARAAASIVEPLLLPDLPVFLRWRGRPAFGGEELERMLEVTDRLIVDSNEWADLPEAYSQLATIFESAAVSDLAWSRSLGWRASLAGLWPGIAELRELRVAGPRADALLLAGWLRGSLDAEVRLAHDEADELELVAVDGESVSPPPGNRPTPSDLLSGELDVFGRDPVYERAVRSVAA